MAPWSRIRLGLGMLIVMVVAVQFYLTTHHFGGGPPRPSSAGTVSKPMSAHPQAVVKAPASPPAVPPSPSSLPPAPPPPPLPPASNVLLSSVTSAPSSNLNILLAAPPPPPPPAAFSAPPPPPFKLKPRFGWGTPRPMIFLGSEKQAWVLGPLMDPSRQITVTVGGSRINKAGLKEMLVARGIPEWNVAEWDDGGIGLLVDLNITLPPSNSTHPKALSTEEKKAAAKMEKAALYDAIVRGVRGAVMETKPSELLVADDGSKESAAAATAAAREGFKVVRVHVGVVHSTKWRKELRAVATEERGTPGYVYFLHAHKAAGSFFSCLAHYASPLQGSHVLEESGGVFCSQERLAHLCGFADGIQARDADQADDHRPRMVPFWQWEFSDQLDMMTGPLQPSDFLANERWLGKHLVPPGTVIGHAGTLRYVTILRDPLERVMSHYRFARRKLNFTAEQFETARCLQPDAGYGCWDSNYYVQQLAGIEACKGQVSTTGDSDSGKVKTECSKHAVETARERLSGLFSVVIILDWLPLYGDLLCVRLGWCDSEVLAWIQATVPACKTITDLASRPKLMARLMHDNQADLELYEFAQEVARQQLHTVGVGRDKLGGFNYSEGGGAKASERRWQRKAEICRAPKPLGEGVVSLGKCSLGPGGLPAGKQKHVTENSKHVTENSPAPVGQFNAPLHHLPPPPPSPPPPPPPSSVAEWEPIAGLQTKFRRLKEGQGSRAVQKGTQVTVHATGRVKASGYKFWSTKDAGQQPFSYQAGVGKVITGWDMGCLGMTVGEVRELDVTPAEGYGDKGFPAWKIPARASLLFEIQVLSIG